MSVGLSTGMAIGTVGVGAGVSALAAMDVLTVGETLGHGSEQTILGIGCVALTLGLFLIVKAFLHELRTTIRANTEAAQRMSDAADAQSKVMVEVKDSMRACEATRAAMLKD